MRKEKAPTDKSAGAFSLVQVLSSLEGREGFLDLLGFVEGAEASGAKFNLDRLAVAHQCLLVDVGEELGFGVAIRVADIVAAHPGF